MNKSILIVDDTAFMRMLLKEIITFNGYFVAGEATNGSEAIEKYMQIKPALVMMDVVMPVMGGIEATKNIMKRDPGAKIIMCTAIGQPSVIMDAMKAGAIGYIVKPFQAAKVAEEMGKVLN
jgi:two-component system chemotaxis response regulator CheY